MQRNTNSGGSESSLSRLKTLVPFYAVPATRKTSAEIISEARAAVQATTMNPPSTISGRLGMKPLSTKRPFTPREKQRTLFGPSKVSRPQSSALSLSLHVEEEEAAEGIGTASPPWGVRLPSLPAGEAVNSRASAKQQRLQFRAASLTKLPEENVVNTELGVVGTSVPRKVHSSPNTSLEGAPQPVPQQPLSAAALAHGTSGKTNSTVVTERPTHVAEKIPAQQSSNVKQNIPTSEPSETQHSFEEVLSLTNVLKILAQESGSATEVEATLRKLFIACERSQMLGRRRGALAAQSAGIRGHLLRTLFLLVQREEQRVLLQLARLLLALQVLGQNLAAVCKLIFKVSRSDQNDQLFLEDNILELLLERLGGASLVEDAEACVYGYGALKFVTMEPSVVARVLQLGGLELMVLHMKLINLMAQEGGGRVPETALQALFQLTGALRHVAGETTALPAFVTTGALTQLCRSLQLFSYDPDLMSNIARTISITSTHDGCCDSLVAQPGCLRTCVTLLENFPRRQDLVVRLSYALGNVMARSEHARCQLLGDEGSRASVLAVLGRCWAEDQATPEQVDFHATEDVLVKVLRVVANASLSEAVGPALADCNELLTAVRGVLTAKQAGHSEELVLGALLTLNNLSFYPSAAQSSLATQQLGFAQALVPLLEKGHPAEARIETLRVFGNLTRWQDTRDFLAQNQVDVRVLELLTEPDPELQYVTIGVLVNLLADPESRRRLRQYNAVQRLASVLRQQGARGDSADWELAGLACQALWNCCADTSTDLVEQLGATDTDTLVTLLADLLDEEHLFGVAEDTDVPEALADSPAFQMWEEFASVATNLLERLESFLDSQQPDSLDGEAISAV